MKLLIDTHILLQAAAATLSKQAAVHIEDEENTLYFSSASIWEVVIKNGLGRNDFIIDPVALYSGLLEAGYIEIGIKAQHSLLVSNLPMLHKDPFDRILVAQAAFEGIPLLTSDKIVARYPVSIIYVE